MTPIKEYLPITANLRLTSSDPEIYIDRVFDWYINSPQIFRAFSAFKTGEKREFLQELRAGRNYALLENGKLRCFIHGEIKDNITIEGHIFCEPKLPIDLQCMAVMFAKNTALLEFQYVVTQVLKKHPILHRVMYRSGFLDMGLRSYNTVYKGQLLEVVHYIAGRDRNGKIED